VCDLFFSETLEKQQTTGSFLILLLFQNWDVTKTVTKQADNRSISGGGLEKGFKAFGSVRGAQVDGRFDEDFFMSNQWGKSEDMTKDHQALEAGISQQLRIRCCCENLGWFLPW